MYLSKEYVEACGIPDGLKQAFKYTASSNCSVSRKQLTDLFSGGALSNKHLAVVEFLFRFSMATPEQILKGTKLDCSVRDLKVMLDKMIQHRLLNKFALVDPENTMRNESIFSDDAFVVYTIDRGGAIVVGTLTDHEDTDHWNVSEIAFDSFRPEAILNTSTKVAKKLSLVDLYLRLDETLGDKLAGFKVNPVYFGGEDAVKCKAMFSILKKEDEYADFIVDVIAESDVDGREENKFVNRISMIRSIILKGDWKLMFKSKTAPSLLLIADTDYAALAGCNCLLTAGIKSVRATTYERMQKDLWSLGAFMSHSKGDDGRGELNEVEVKLFKP